MAHFAVPFCSLNRRATCQVGLPTCTSHSLAPGHFSSTELDLIRSLLSPLARILNPRGGPEKGRRENEIRKLAKAACDSRLSWMDGRMDGWSTDTM